MKIFVADVLVHILKKMPEESPYKIITITSAKEIIETYEKIVAKGSSPQSEYHFFAVDYKKITTDFKARFEVIEAAGGVVMKADKILFMKRLGKWDLPKGKIDKGEDYQMAAIREIAEECGVKAKILYKIGCTWHTFTQADKSHKLKKTVWFAMECLNDSNKAPQAEEGITKVKWTKYENIERKLLNSYASIVHIYRKFEWKQLRKMATIEISEEITPTTTPIIENM
jgi:ADP-ribose pyrophosphatase YjhB (NUDIX family)